jgi:hypothetical protein
MIEGVNVGALEVGVAEGRNEDPTEDLSTSMTMRPFIPL